VPVRQSYAGSDFIPQSEIFEFGYWRTANRHGEETDRSKIQKTGGHWAVGTNLNNREKCMAEKESNVKVVIKTWKTTS
jgi:hypothetical protein